MNSLFATRDQSAACTSRLIGQEGTDAPPTSLGANGDTRTGILMNSRAADRPCHIARLMRVLFF